MDQGIEEYYVFKSDDEKSLKMVSKGMPEFTEIVAIREEPK